MAPLDRTSREPRRGTDEQRGLLRPHGRPPRELPVAACTGHGRAVRRGKVALLAALSVALVAGLASMAGWARRLPHTPGRAALGAAVTLLDWERQAKQPPWLSPIKEGAEKAVAIVLGQSLKPDGKPSQLLVGRATKAKELLDNGTVESLIASGGDPAGVGHTEASTIAKVLMDLGVPKEKIILESQATTTAENAWFALRWIPEGTGQFYIVTSEFHMPRARYTIDATFNYFYRTVEEAYKDHPSWKDKAKGYPRLTIHEVPAASFCGNSSSNRDGNHTADISEFSLASRAAEELEMIGSGWVVDTLFGMPTPLGNKQMIWPIQVNVTQDPNNTAKINRALAEMINVRRALCVCTSPPEGRGLEMDYPLRLPVSTQLPDAIKGDDWKEVMTSCEPR